ncbi:MAG: restriction endonuclease [Methylomonas sp.]|jgi:restriction endonuclease Mrr
MKSDKASLLLASAKYIHSLKEIAKEAESIAKLEGLLEETDLILLNFNWLALKYRFFWFDNAETEAYVASNLPDIELFTPLDFEQLVQAALYLIEDKLYNTTAITNDGGIDLYIEEIFDKHYGACLRTVIQCKLYRGYVPVTDIRDFFGVMVAKIATGLFITTGRLTNQELSFIPIANASPHANKLYYIERKDWDEILSLAEQIYEQLTELENSDEVDYEMITAQIEKIQNKAKLILYFKKNNPVQESLF